MLSNMFLGCCHYEATAVLSASLLLSTFLSNKRARVSLNTADINKMERIDEQFLREVFSSQAYYMND